MIRRDYMGIICLAIIALTAMAVMRSCHVSQCSNLSYLPQVCK